MDQRDVGGESGVKEARIESKDGIERVWDRGDVIERDEFILGGYRTGRKREGWANLNLLKDGRRAGVMWVNV